jgi:hypothetical protein
MSGGASLALMLAAGLAFQGPPVRNGSVETRAGAIADAVAAERPDGVPVWLAWTVPMVSGATTMCTTWTDGETWRRGLWLENRAARDTTPPATPEAIPIEGGTKLVVLARVVNGTVERLRLATDDCPIDAGGRRFVWLADVAPPASVAFLGTLMRPGADAPPGHESLPSSAVGAIALHADGAAERLLLASLEGEGGPLRRESAHWLARTRSALAFGRLQTLIAAERDTAQRRALVAALASTRETGTLAHLLRIAETDREPAVRGNAMYAYARQAPESVLSNVVQLIEREPSRAVQSRAIAGIAARGHTGVPVLLLLARDRSGAPEARREAVRALSRSPDDRAIAFLEGILRR